MKNGPMSLARGIGLALILIPLAAPCQDVARFQVEFPDGEPAAFARLLGIFPNREFKREELIADEKGQFEIPSPLPKGFRLFPDPIHYEQFAVISGDKIENPGTVPMLSYSEIDSNRFLVRLPKDQKRAIVYVPKLDGVIKLNLKIDGGGWDLPWSYHVVLYAEIRPPVELRIPLPYENPDLEKIRGRSGSASITIDGHHRYYRRFEIPKEYGGCVEVNIGDEETSVHPWRGELQVRFSDGIPAAFARLIYITNWNGRRLQDEMPADAYGKLTVSCDQRDLSTVEFLGLMKDWLAFT